MAFFVTRLCFYRSRLYFLLMSTENIDRASIGGSIGGGWALPEALAPSFTHPLKCVEEKEVNLGADRHKIRRKTAPTRLELLLKLEGDFRKRLGPIRVTPSQAGVILFLRRQADANVTDAATALGVSQATLSRTVTTLVRNQWVAKRRSAKDVRVVALSLSRRGNALALQINQRVRQVNAPLAQHTIEP
jgi:DNA-binding MarR family transcriptional regulator